jgi:ATP-dependent 26S proteasome regulatory subunit
MEFAALGGAEGPKQALRELVALPLRVPHLFARYHVEPPRGILLYGSPGAA